MTNTLTIKSAKGTAITLAVDSSGFVTATVNGVVHRGTHDSRGVMMLRATKGPHTGDYITISNGVAAFVAADDIAPAKAFLDAALRIHDASAHERARAQHEIDMQDPAYAARIASERLTADMDRADSNN